MARLTKLLAVLEFHPANDNATGPRAPRPAHRCLSSALDCETCQSRTWPAGSWPTAAAR